MFKKNKNKYLQYNIQEQILGVLLHELRPIISNVGHNIHTLKAQNKGNKISSTIEKIEREIILLESITSSISNSYTSVLASDLSKGEEIFKVNPLLLAITKFNFPFVNELRAKNIQIVYSSLDRNLYIKWNKSKLAQIVLSIMQNSIEAYSLSKKVYSQKIIDIKSFKEKKMIFLEFSDNAGGIDSNVLSEIGNKAVSSKEGIKVGHSLLLCKNTLSEIGGELDIQSSNESTSIKITIPSYEGREY